VFRGRFEVSLDERGRLAMPKRYQESFKPVKDETGQELSPEKIPSQLVIAPDAVSSRPCLLIYPLCEWEKVEAQLKQFPASNKQCQNIKTIFSLAMDVELDEKGRFVIPSYLLEHIDLSVKTKTYLMGKQSRLELWDKELWDAEIAAAMQANKQAQETGELPQELLDFVM